MQQSEFIERLKKNGVWAVSITPNDSNYFALARRAVEEQGECSWEEFFSCMRWDGNNQPTCQEAIAAAKANMLAEHA